jgi:hypothetical protein
MLPAPSIDDRTRVAQPAHDKIASLSIEIGER